MVDNILGLEFAPSKSSSADPLFPPFCYTMDGEFRLDKSWPVGICLARISARLVEQDVEPVIVLGERTYDSRIE